MTKSKKKRLILIGNQNTGKSTLFNSLCGVRQKTGNFPGVTVDRKIGKISKSTEDIAIVDLPGINSIRPQSIDEKLVRDFLMNQVNDESDDLIVAVASSTNLKKTLYLIDQIRDLNRPMVLVLTMGDLAKKRGITIDNAKLEKYFGFKVIQTSRKENLENFDWLSLFGTQNEQLPERNPKYLEESLIDKIKNEEIAGETFYEKFLALSEGEISSAEIKARDLRQNEAILRHKNLSALIEEAVRYSGSKYNTTKKLDQVFLHPVLGYLCFGFILVIIFQAVFWLAAYPMEWIDIGFAQLSTFAQNHLPEGYLFDLIANGLIPGIGGVVIFLPQIAVLFFLFALLEESGYMQRAVVLSDKIMQKFGMSGKSIIPLVSGMACAIPAIMSARTIENKKERLITILVTPLMTCSARIPVYVILIAIIIPDTSYGVINLQGLVLMGMYLFGILIALLAAFVLKLVIKSKETSIFLIELPDYLTPDFKSVGIYVWEKCRVFLFSAGKIIVAASLILYVLATTGNSDVTITSDYEQTHQDEIMMENSYLGKIGKTIEPVIEPLGYDWKIGIALVSSIAAREVFVGTLAVIYSIDSEDEMTIKDRLMSQRNPQTNGLVYSFATCISLLLFYAFALQCVSTIAITYKETNSIKWTSVQFIYMLVLAYFSALIAYQLLK